MFGHVSIPYQRHEKISGFQQYHLSEIRANTKLNLLIFLKPIWHLFMSVKLMKDPMKIWKFFFYLLQITILGIMRILLAFSYFPTYSEIWSPPNLPLCGIFKALGLWADAFYKSKFPSAFPCVRLSIRLFTFEVPFNCLFAHTSQSRMSNIFRASESLGESNGKKWSQIWTFLFQSGLRSPKKKCFCWFCLTKKSGNHASRWIRDLWSKGI